MNVEFFFFFFPNSSFGKFRAALELRTRLKRFCKCIFLKTEECELCVYVCVWGRGGSAHIWLNIFPNSEQCHSNKSIHVGSSLLQCFTMSGGKWLLTFRTKTVQSSSPRLLGLLGPEMEAPLSSKASLKYSQLNMVQHPKRHVSSLTLL